MKFYLVIIDKWACCKLFVFSSTIVTFVSKLSTLEANAMKCLNLCQCRKQRWFDIFVDFVIFLFISNNLWNVICKNIMIVVNWLFKNMIYESINDLTFENVVKTFYRTMLSHWELSFFCIFDRDSQFVNHFWNQLCRKLNIKIKLFTIYHLETNDQIENANDIMKQYFKAFCNYLQNDWVK